VQPFPFPVNRNTGETKILEDANLRSKIIAQAPLLYIFVSLRIESRHQKGNTNPRMILGHFIAKKVAEDMIFRSNGCAGSRPIMSSSPLLHV
jgi:hypothetical protein